ncbi:hypothetical protein PILCRDRAFT_822879 [Piloderma croceum F 1598]|uniref:Uncharacterized protein n=1 Tax=Piloderma croceum (strain F 1598) TaxID=765440 RepID=A0A0C3FKH7_PILCF|nr:hypothetical protein PILCRDRAFT_822879 [Piloderma croceum F 1598]
MRAGWSIHTGSLVEREMREKREILVQLLNKQPADQRDLPGANPRNTWLQASDDSPRFLQSPSLDLPAPSSNRLPHQTFMYVSGDSPRMLSGV